MKKEIDYEALAWKGLKKSHPNEYSIKDVLRFGFWSLVMGFLIGMLFCASAFAGDLVYNFKSPAFSGVGYSSHVLTIENLTHQRKKDIQAKIEADQREAERAAKNTNVNKFLANLESRIYAELSKQISDKLFGENPQESGTIDLLGNTISYQMTDSLVTLDVLQSDGTNTKVEIPIAQFAF